MAVLRIFQHISISCCLFLLTKAVSKASFVQNICQCYAKASSVDWNAPTVFFITVAMVPERAFFILCRSESGKVPLCAFFSETQICTFCSVVENSYLCIRKAERGFLARAAMSLCARITHMIFSTTDVFIIFIDKNKFIWHKWLF